MAKRHRDVPFTKRGHITKSEVLHALRDPERFQVKLYRAHVANCDDSTIDPLQVRISGPAGQVLQTVQQLRDLLPVAHIGLRKNEVDKRNRCGKFNPYTLCAYVRLAEANMAGTTAA